MDLPMLGKLFSVDIQEIFLVNIKSRILDSANVSPR